MKRIIWLDDEHRYHTYDDYLPLFRQRGYELLMVVNPMDFFRCIESGSIPLNEIVCFIVDMSFHARAVDGFEASEGVAVGKELINKLKSTESPFKDVSMVVYTVVEEDKDVELICKKNGIPYLLKDQCYLKDFIKEVIRVIEK